ncbi:MAG: Cys-tRNA(Pro) deacylase [Oscillospiraceae bacterium]|nr:Cys-tRNA(Pro) deacylase [Oscillospiraceae bacterium]
MTVQKTNVMRLLEQKKIPYRAYSYPHDGSAVDAVTVAALLERDPATIFKTLAARASDKSCCVFVIPAGKELDLKKAARAVGAKSVAMLHLNELTELTGYVRGGCSPIGMKKLYRTVIDESALRQETILVSAGKIGAQVELEPQALAGMIRASFADLTSED